MKLPISSTAVPLLLYGLQLGGPYLLTFLKNHICGYLSFHPNPGNFELIKYSSPRKMNITSTATVYQYDSKATVSIKDTLYNVVYKPGILVNFESSINLI